MYIIIQYAKIEEMIYLGHLDLMHLWERLIRIVNLPIAYSNGFNRKQKLNLIQALSLGFEGLNELLHIELTEQIDLVELKKTLNVIMPKGLIIKKIIPVKYNAKWFYKHKDSVIYELKLKQKSEVVLNDINILKSKQTKPGTYRIKVKNTPELQLNIKQYIFSVRPDIDIMNIKRVRLLFC